METSIQIVNDIIHVGGRKKLPTHAIIKMEADINYTIITMNTGQRIMVATTLKKIEQRINDNKNFFRVNKSYILNLDYAQIEGNLLILPDNYTVEFSRRKFKKFQEMNLAA
jgi:DNA-binding LytR/AlgR family response regulator